MKGVKGVSFNDRQLAGQVRKLALDHLAVILSPKYKNKAYQKQMLLKLANTILPRLNEHTGEGGESISIVFDKTFQK